MRFRDRIKDFRRVKASEMLANPRNSRMHPETQQNALRGVLAEIGFADAVLARELPDGSLMLVDGHLRAEVAADSEVPVLVLDVNEAEADKLLASLDPLAALAETDAAKLEELLRDIDTGNPALQEMFATMATEAGIVPPDFQPTDDKVRLDQVAQTTCPHCGHTFKPLLQRPTCPT